MNRLRLIFCKNTQFYLYIEISSVLFSFFAVFLLSLQSKSYKEPMILENISIINYKNIKGVNLDLSPKINCLIGHNGVGKTNFLDAIYYLSFCRSANNPIDSQIIMHDENFFMLEGNYRTEQGDIENIYCGMKRGTKKHFKRNKKEYKRLSQHIGLVPLIYVSPSDSSLIEGGSEERRRLMDVVISQYDHSYIELLSNYNKALQQRNALLKMEEEPDSSLLDIWEPIHQQKQDVSERATHHYEPSPVPIYQARTNQAPPPSSKEHYAAGVPYYN